MKKTVFTLILSALAVFAMAQYPLVPIDTTQYVSPTRLANIGVGGNDSTLADYIFPTHHNPTYGDTVVVEGIVVFDPASYGLSTSQSRVSAFIQAADDRSWSGVEIMMDTAVLNPKPTKAALDAASQFSQNLKKGRMVRVTTIIGNFQGNTQLYILPVPIQVLSTGNTITAQEIEVGDVMKNVAGNPTPQFATGEQWEGTYVEIKDVFVTNVSASGQRWFWSVQDDNGNSIQIRDYSNYYRNDNNDADPNTPRNFTPPTTNTRLDYIRGVITEGVVSGQRLYFIAPLYPDDVAVPLFNAPSVKSVKRIPAVVTPSVSPTIRVNVQDDSAIASVTLYYAVGYANTTFTPVTMTGTDSIYTAQIPAQSLGSIVKYYIHAEDNGGHSVNFPDSLALTSAYKVINSISSISDIQETVYSNGGSMFVNDTLRGITVPGIVVSTNASNDLGLFTLQSGTGPWSAIFVRPTVGDGVATWKRGDSIVITEAVVTERFNQGADPFGSRSNAFGVTFLEGVKFTVAGRCKAMPVVTNLSVDSLISPTFNKEQYEAMMIRYNDAFVVDTNPDFPSDFGEWLVNTDSTATNGLRGENYSGDLGFTFNTDSLTPGQKLPVFQGVLSFAHGNWKVYPRNRTDVGLKGDMIPPYIIKNGPDTVYHPIHTAYVDLGAYACDDMDGDVSSNVNINTSTVDTSTAGTYTVTFTVADAAGNQAAPVTRIVIVQDGSSVLENGKSISLGLYPVPATSFITLAIGSNYHDAAVVNIVDITGKTVATHNVEFTAGNNTISLPASQLASGVYFCQFSSQYYNTVQKFVVVK